jgi:formylglycine-generating enzyme required for sulfatase activity
MLLVALSGTVGAVWWVSRGTDDNGVAPKTSVAQNVEKESPNRVPEGWKPLDATPGFDRWARKVVDPRTGIVFILVEPGHFMMGSPDGEGEDNEHPRHEVRITMPFYLAETETTAKQWRRFDLSGRPDKSPRHAVQHITWRNASAFCKRHGYRLPTEAEWEYVCRAGTTGQTHGDLDEIAWHGGNSGYESHPVAEKKPNPWGFYDMLGNLHEWCADAYDKDFYRKEVRDDPFVADGPWRVVRGGSWFYHPTGIRVADRIAYVPGARVSGLGFRCAKGLLSP